MKKTIVLTIAIAFFVIKAHAQFLPNASFENWTMTTLYEEPTPFVTTNFQTFLNVPMGNVKKSSDHVTGLYSAKLETVHIAPDTVPGYLVLGNPIPGGISGGMPYTASPDSLLISAKFNIMPNDTARFVVFFKNSGAIIGNCVAQFTGSQPNFASFSFPCYIAPWTVDTIAVIAISSNFDFPGIPGSYIYFDDVKFKLAASILPFPNGDFETWTPRISEEPDSWATTNWGCIDPLNPAVTKSTDHYDGTYAIKVVNKPTLWNDTLAYVTNGVIGQSGPTGGVPVPQNPSLLSGYYKYYPVGLDTAFIGGFTSRWDGLSQTTVNVETGMIPLTAASTWTYFEIPITYNSWPFVDTINVAFASGNINGSFAGLGSALYVDALSLSYYPVSINEITTERPLEIIVFPNPANWLVQLSFNTPVDENGEIRITDAYGREVYKKDYSGSNPKESLTLDVSALSAGLYFVKMETPKRSAISKLIIK